MYSASSCTYELHVFAVLLQLYRIFFDWKCIFVQYECDSNILCLSHLLEYMWNAHFLVYSLHRKQRISGTFTIFSRVGSFFVSLFAVECFNHDIENPSPKIWNIHTQKKKFIHDFVQNTRHKFMLMSFQVVLQWVPVTNDLYK